MSFLDLIVSEVRGHIPWSGDFGDPAEPSVSEDGWSIQLGIAIGITVLALSAAALVWLVAT